MNILKNTLAIGFLLSLVPVSLTAQTKKNSNETSLVKEIKTTPDVGKKYRINVDIKCTSADSSSRWGIFTLQVGKNDYDFINASGKSNFSTTQNAEWKTFSIEGTILPNSKKIWIYLITSGNGDFYFDNLEFKLQDENAGWETVKIDNHDFEQTTDIKSVLKEFKNTKAVLNNSNIKASIAVLDNANKALYISSKNNSVTYKNNYGQNTAAGNYITAKDGKKIYYESYGEGEPLLLLHGNGGSIHSFQDNIPELAKYYKVIAVDTRGQGNSIDNETENFTYDLFADDLEVLIEKLGIKKLNIVGWSDGAIIGLLLSIRHPDLVDKLVMMGANLNPSGEAINERLLKQTQKDIEKLKKDNAPGSLVTVRLLEMLLKYPDIPLSDLHKVKARALVMAGEKDLVLEKHTRLIAENIPNAQINIVKGETHFLPEENAVLFNKIVVDFLK